MVRFPRVSRYGRGRHPSCCLSRSTNALGVERLDDGVVSLGHVPRKNDRGADDAGHQVRNDVAGGKTEIHSAECIRASTQ